jgi:hypothetical protein
LKYTIDAGYFINTSPIDWSSALTTTKGGKTVVLVPSIKIEVTWSNDSLTHFTRGGYSSKYRFIRSGNYLLLLDSSLPTGTGSVRHDVFVVDFNSSSEIQIISTGFVPSTVNPPNIHYSQGTGSAFFVFNPNGSKFENIGIYGSDNGAPLCILYSTADLLPMYAEATNNDLIIHYVDNVSKSHSCPQ